ncbi:BppU family phage baseplate upper protein [Lacticaseibacillus paracasei]|uniref:BppU family phage baseplate upper protein n=1 Tax=Lacticaseibacillus paracasei TaxID=1597 RepID=UPI00336B4F48
MAIRTYKVTLDTKNAIAPEPVYLRQGDKTGAVVIDATLMDNGAPVSLDGLTPMFKANTADGQAVIADSTGFNIVNASGGEFTYQVPSQLGSVSGKIKIAYFSFTDPSGSQSTFDVVFVVSPAADMTQESAKDWVSNLNDIISQYNQWVNDAHSSWQEFVDANKEILKSIDPGGKILSELIASRGSYDSLNDRLNDFALKVPLSLPQTELNDIGQFPNQFRTTVESFANSIDSTKFRILIVTDSHYEDLLDETVQGSYPYGGMFALNHLAVVDYLSHFVDVVIAGGDNTNGIDNSIEHTLSDQILYASRLIQSASSSDKFMILGNHDDGSPIAAQGTTVTPSMVLTNEQISKAFMADQSPFGEKRDNGSLYFYKDYPNKKIRVIGLNSLDIPYTLTNSDGSSKYTRWLNYNYSQAQFDWLTNVALVMPEGYSFVIFTHVPLIYGYTPAPTAHWYNSNILEQVINAAASGTSVSASSSADVPSDVAVSVNANFSSQGTRNCIGLWGGHVHIENITKLEHFTQVLFLADVNAVPANIGTTNELGITVAEVDTENKSVSLKGLGRATNRSYLY